MVETTDAAYRFVSEANRKEAANQKARAKKSEPSWGLNLFVGLVLCTVSYTHFADSNTGFGFFMLALLGFNFWVVFKLLVMKRSKRHADN